MDSLATFDRIGWVARQSRSLQRRLRAGGRRHRLDAGQWVYGEGDAETGLCAVLEGALRLEVSVGGDCSALIGLVPAPAILGQSRRHGGGPRILTARAGPPSTVLLISDAALEAIATDEPHLWRAVSELLYAQLEMMVRLAAQLLALRPRARVAARLLQLASDGRVRASQHDLGEMCGLTRKGISAHLAVLEHEQVIRRGYGVVQLLDAAALQRIAADHAAR